jgi:hypothetical protein
MAILQNGLFINSAGIPFTIINGVPYELDSTTFKLDKDLKKLKPGYYDEKLNPVPDPFDV